MFDGGLFCFRSQVSTASNSLWFIKSRRRSVLHIVTVVAYTTVTNRLGLGLFYNMALFGIVPLQIDRQTKKKQQLQGCVESFMSSPLLLAAVQIYLLFSARCSMYIHLALMLRCHCPSVCPSVRLSVTEVHWRIIANLGFKFRSQFTAHCGRGACWREGRDHRREEWRDHLALC